MLNAYKVLGVGAEASRDEVRSAYVRLAKRYHPDRNTATWRDQQRLRDVNEAYDVLKDRERRSRYDQQLRQSREATRRSRRRAAIVMAGSFALTTSVASALLFSVQPAQRSASTQIVGETSESVASEDTRLAFDRGPFAATSIASAAMPLQLNDPMVGDGALAPMKDRADTGVVPEGVAQASTTTTSASVDLAEPQTWATYSNARFGFSIDYPSDVLIPDGQALGDFWRLFVSKDGHARLLVTAGSNFKRLTSQAYRQSLMDDSYRTASVEYAPLRKTWFVLAGSMGEEMFYDRTTFACDGRVIHRWRLLYPSSAREYYKPIIERVHQGYKHIRGVGPHCR